MGAYIRYKIGDGEETSAKGINDWLDEQAEQQALVDIEGAQQVHFWDQGDEAIAREEHGQVPSSFPDIGEGALKASCTPPQAKELWADLFERLHEEFEVRVLASSCAMRLDHLSGEQLTKISNDGAAISGDESEQERVRGLLDAQ